MLNTAYFSWSHIELNVAGRTVTGCEAVRFNEAQDKQYVYGTGNMPLTVREGNVAIEGTLTLLQGDYEFLASNAPNGSLLGYRNATISVAIRNPEGDFVTYRVMGVFFTTGNGLDGQQGQTSLTREVPFMALSIRVNR